ncbi:EAL domain-containing response regulator [Paucibacter sp. M5-1]|uniref:EAL domain-containing response regulator n=1 Tax=Paucibacter sp. M5-1 TaxID=3015998 RepID=UPI0022B8E64B|nr:EAL domain-containing response regulator [Paucibacter sp. M5-1]MCZ7885014.1 EAL domain-containing response regulator [Paucibacter sp. M5-1]
MPEHLPDIWPTFVPTLPLGLGPPEGPMPSGSVRKPHRQPSLLLVDDDPFMLGMQSRMLRSMGFTMIGTAASAEAALALLSEGRAVVDVVICDLNMPGVDGLEFLRRLGDADFRGNIILLSGEGPRIIHAVQKLLSSRSLRILGALEKPAGRTSLRMLLDLWQPEAEPTALAQPPVFSAADLLAAQQAEQWVLHYQPKVELRSGALIGVEALLRWNHPLHGLVYPDRFIDLAEDCGAIGPLTDWVLHTALAQLALWHRSGLQIHMAVNVSMESLRAADFAPRLGALVRLGNLSPQDLMLEVTESRVMAISSAQLETLVRLCMQRFGLSIDDFGTGHSSLAQLRDVPFTELKIDRGFVHGAAQNQLIRPMLEGSIGIAQRLGLQTVAEGVETDEDWALLRAIGCDIAQGYFIARPMPSENLAAWLAEWLLRRPQLLAP